MDDFASHIAIPSLITGIIFSLLGWAFYQSPSSEINNLVGYRTRRSMKSQEHWDFAQRLSGKLTGIAGCCMVALSLLSYLIPVDTEYKQIGGLVLVALSAIYTIAGTEIALIKRFPKTKK